MAKEYNFLVDTYSGIDTWIQVENGIITKFRNFNKNYLSKLNENYLGKTISFFKEDFENRMKPSWHCVKSRDFIDSIAIVEATKSRLDQYRNYLYQVKYRVIMPAPLTKEEHLAIRDLETQITKAEINFEATKKMLKEVHNFEIKV
jgi:hypothetical protein